ncbi:MAG: metallophosphoesterase family protein [Pseudomonadota bacterium]
MLQDTAALKISDLGELSGKLLVFGGAYSNLQALEALRQRAEKHQIQPENVLCTGDVVAYCADPEACVEFVKDWGISVLAGNCERNLAEDADDCGCGFQPDMACSLLARSWYAHAQSQTSDASKRWMGTLPNRIVFMHNGKRYALIHGGTRDISKFIWPTTSDAEITEELGVLKDQVGAVDVVLSGHSGIAMRRICRNVEWVNAGVIGMPDNTGVRHTCYAVINQDIAFHNLEYDWKTAQQRMRQAGLDQGYDQTLETGFWPSEDVLPTEMRVQKSV